METLGINFQLLAFQIFNFTVIVLLLNKLLFKPLSKRMEERKTLIEQGLAKEGQVDIKLAEIEKDKQEMVDKTRKEIDEMMADAAVKANDMKKEMIDGARKESEELVKRAKEQLAGEKEEMMTEAKGQVADLAIEAVKTILGSDEASELKGKLNKKAIDRLWQKNKNQD